MGLQLAQAFLCEWWGFESAFAAEYRQLTWTCYRRPQLAHVGRWMMTESSEASRQVTSAAFTQLSEGMRGSLPQGSRTGQLLQAASSPPCDI